GTGSSARGAGTWPSVELLGKALGGGEDLVGADAELRCDPLGRLARVEADLDLVAVDLGAQRLQEEDRRPGVALGSGPPQPGLEEIDGVFLGCCPVGDELGVTLCPEIRRRATDPGGLAGGPDIAAVTEYVEEAPDPGGAGAAADPDYLTRGRAQACVPGMDSRAKDREGGVAARERDGEIGAER